MCIRDSTITSRSSVQSTLINNVILGEYDCAGWNQFGGCDESQNYVWWNSQSATAALTAGGLGMPGLPAGTAFPGAVNFAHQADPVVEAALLTALASRPGSAAKTTAWQTVNRRFASEIPYVLSLIHISNSGSGPMAGPFARGPPGILGESRYDERSRNKLTIA